MLPFRSYLKYSSAGGIIALGLGVETWSVDDCITQFKALCGPAFTPRRGRRIFGLAQMVEAHYHSKYETRPLQASLMDAFSDNRLFGGLRFDNRRQSKVAVTATSSAGLQTIVLSNYNRIGGDQRCTSDAQAVPNGANEYSTISLPTSRQPRVRAEGMGSVSINLINENPRCMAKLFQGHELPPPHQRTTKRSHMSHQSRCIWMGGSTTTIRLQLQIASANCSGQTWQNDIQTFCFLLGPVTAKH